MNSQTEIEGTRSTADVVFDHLFEEIVSLTLLPGTKISEAEVAKRFGVSRQPIRDAFRRLGNINLLNIRPQRATVVRHFSLQEIQNTRFLRLAVELEVIERACATWNAENAAVLADSIKAQKAALDSGDAKRFHALDYDFHRIICETSNQPLAFEMIESCKRNVDRLCVLSLSHRHEREDVLTDHIELAEALEQRDVGRARALIRKHLGRLDPVVDDIYVNHRDYFQ